MIDGIGDDISNEPSLHLLIKLGRLLLKLFW